MGATIALLSVGSKTLDTDPKLNSQNIYEIAYEISNAQYFLLFDKDPIIMSE